MIQHKKKKHGIPVKQKGRPRKYPLYDTRMQEIKKYEEEFFSNNFRAPIEGEVIDTHNIVYQVFDFIYNGKFSDKLFLKPKNIEENYILRNLYLNAPLTNKEKHMKNCDEVFYEYLQEFKDKTNKKYFKFLLKFIIILEECYYINKTKFLKEEEKKRFIEFLNLNDLPVFCNDFYTEFLEPNNFFDLFENENENSGEIVEIIQHLCHWLSKNEYTSYKLSLAN